MTFPLSQDPRGRIVRAVAEGSSIRQAAALLTVYHCIKLPAGYAATVEAIISIEF
jgi:hypothetical protein